MISMAAKILCQNTAGQNPMSKTLTPPQLHAIAVAGKTAKSVRSDLTADHTYRIDFGVRVKGQLKVGDKQPLTSHAKPTLQPIVAALLRYFGPRKAKTIVDEIVAGGYADSIKAKDDAAELAIRLIRELTTPSTGTKAGSVTGTFDLELV